jgi:hypothetical protein
VKYYDGEQINARLGDAGLLRGEAQVVMVMVREKWSHSGLVASTRIRNGLTLFVS